jgi:hypothetical protein
VTRAPREGEGAALADGTELLVRQLRPSDKRLLAEGFERLSPESRYRRFFRPLDRLSKRDLAYLTEIDHCDHEALAAIDAETGELVAVARYVRGAEPQRGNAAALPRCSWSGWSSTPARLGSPTSSRWSWTTTPRP